MLHDRYFFVIIYMGDGMENFEDLCIKILDGIDLLILEGDYEGISRYTAAMREQVELCRSMSKNER